MLLDREQYQSAAIVAMYAWSQAGPAGNEDIALGMVEDHRKLGQNQKVHGEIMVRWDENQRFTRNLLML